MDRGNGKGGNYRKFNKSGPHHEFFYLQVDRCFSKHRRTWTLARERLGTKLETHQTGQRLGLFISAKKSGQKRKFKTNDYNIKHIEYERNKSPLSKMWQSHIQKSIRSGKIVLLAIQQLFNFAIDTDNTRVSALDADGLQKRQRQSQHFRYTQRRIVITGSKVQLKLYDCFHWYLIRNLALSKHKPFWHHSMFSNLRP